MFIHMIFWNNEELLIKFQIKQTHSSPNFSSSDAPKYSVYIAKKCCEEIAMSVCKSEVGSKLGWLQAIFHPHEGGVLHCEGHHL
jgi:hypothetical protein